MNSNLLLIMTSVWIFLGAGLFSFALFKRKKLPVRIAVIMMISGLVSIVGGVFICSALIMM